jgi:hypothetical protein
VKIALGIVVPSSESDLVRQVLSEKHDVFVQDPYDVDSHATVFDVGVCVGPVAHKPLAKKTVLVVVGATRSHASLSWDVVAVSSEKSKVIAGDIFPSSRVVVVHHFIADLELGRRRNCDVFNDPVYLHASEFGWGECRGVLTTGCWGRIQMPGWLEVPSGRKEGHLGVLRPMEFNTLIRQGAVGIYPDWMEDGFDLQARRHLALGGRVMCRRDFSVLGKCVGLCRGEALSEEERKLAEGDRQTYARELLELVEGG